VRVADEFVALAFAGDARFAKCQCRECRNLIRLKKVKVSYHVFKHGFMPNYLVWCERGEVETTVESDGDQDVDRMDDMVDDIRNEYPELWNNQALPEDVKEFYKLLEALEAKVHEGTDVTVLQAVTHLMAMKSKYSFSNNCYNDIVKLIIDLIPSNHNMPKDLYHCRRTLYIMPRKLPQSWMPQRSLREEMLLQRRLQHRLHHSVPSGILIVELSFICK
jgi:hypothetical protein